MLLTFVIIILINLFVLHQTIKISDKNILLMISENKLEAWRHLYDKYASLMFGVICNLTDDRALAEDIFKETFLQLKEKNILSRVTYSLCSVLLRHTHITARQQLKEKGISIKKDQINENLIINILCSQNLTLKELAEKKKLNEVEARKKIRAEFLELRSKTK